MKKILICSVLVGATLISCTEKTDVALTVFRDKQEDKLLQQVGEGEAAIEFYRRQYGVLKERLVRLRTMEILFQKQSDQAMADGKITRSSFLDQKLAMLHDRIPKAERELNDFYEVLERKREEIRLIKDETYINTAMAKTTTDLPTVSAYEKRKETIDNLVESLREKASRSEALLQVSLNEERMIQNETK
jgi:hypothetical protein